MNADRWTTGVLASALLLWAAQAQAHFKLLKPASWLNEDALGGPQKGSPCGPGNSRPFIGDDMSPAPASNAVTTFQAGEKITVELAETVYHPGYYRISIAPVSAAKATTKEFPDPPLTDPKECFFDKAAVKTSPHDSVIGDGLFMTSENMPTGRSLMQEVTLPNEPCEECTLQIVQVMEGHGASSCFYYHCANIKIVAADGSSNSEHAGSHASHDTAGSAGSATHTDADSEDDGGCSVATLGATRSSHAGWGSVAIATIGVWRSRRRRALRASPRDC
jgi:Lytic polysaccharide mono-oxygenase, cellulose-degrading